MNRDIRVQIVAGVTMLALLGASAGLTTRIAASAGRNRLVYTDRAEDGAPTEEALGIAFGAFRGVFVNFLWIRANQLKEDGKYYEAIDLASTITKLQPRYPRVWAFHAWNLAYNISVATQTPEERWQWVRAGIDLLRRQGIPANPSDLTLHRELAWIFLHKVQGFLDDANIYYKRELAREWTYAVGTPPARVIGGKEAGTAERTEQFAAMLRPIAAAPDTLESVYQAAPKARELAATLREAGIDVTTDQGREFLLRAYEETATLPRIVQELELTMDLPKDSLAGMLFAEDTRDAAALLIAHLRRRLIVDYYHMEPERMLRYTEKYGPLDWRHPASHAIYWASRGVEESTLRMTRENRKDFDFINTDRMCIQAVQELFRSGDIYYDLSNPEFYVTMQDVDFINVYGRIVREHAEREQEEMKGQHGANVSNRVFRVYAAGYENFLRDAIRFLYRRGDEEGANAYLKALRDADWLNVNNPFQDLDFNLPVREFVVNEVVKDDQFTRPAVAMQEIEGAFQAAFLNGLRVGNMDMFNTNMNYARAFHERYVKEKIFNTGVNQEDRARMELFPRDFEEYAGTVLSYVINIAREDNGGVVMFRRAPTWLQRASYAKLKDLPIHERLIAMEQQGGKPFAVLFPEPPGMEEYLADVARRRQNIDAGRHEQQ